MDIRESVSKRIDDSNNVGNVGISWKLDQDNTGEMNGRTQ